MKRLELDKKEINKIIKLKENGESIREICRIINRSQALVQRILNEKNKKNKFDKDKDYIAICKKTKKFFNDYENKSGTLTSHIKNTFPDIEIPSKFIRKKYEIQNGFTWYEIFFDIKEKELKDKKTKKCKFCEWETTDIENYSGAYTKHIKNEHNMEIEKYIKIFPEESCLFSTFLNKKTYKIENESNKDNFIECQICKEKMRKITNTHLKKHGLSIKIYKNKFGDTMSNRTKEKFVELGEKNSSSIIMTKRDTKIELKIKEILDKLKINYIQQYKKGTYYFDFLLTDENILLEIDGDFWHGYDRESNWDYSVFNNIINDYKKSLNEENLIRIREKTVNELKIEDFQDKEKFIIFLKNNNTDIKKHKIFNLKESDIIFSKEYCINKFDINNKNTIKLVNNILFLWKEFYNPYNHNCFIDLDKRKQIDFKLKGIFFKEFYSAHKIKSKNLFEIFKNDEILKKTIIYRLGINNSKEFFDFNIKNLYRGLEVRTLFNVGIFPVKKAKEIFEKNTEKNDNIFDPFMGWGSRLVSLNDVLKNKNCSFTGNDLNKDLIHGYNYITEKILKLDSKEKIKISIKNSIEYDLSLKNSIDFIFTSPPFYNDEIYENKTIKFNSIKEWGENLILPIFKNCFNYLKSNKKMIIDMKGKYCDEIINCAINCGFLLENKEEYKISNTHYSNKDYTKNQFLITFIKP